MNYKLGDKVVVVNKKSLWYNDIGTIVGFLDTPIPSFKIRFPNDDEGGLSVANIIKSDVLPFVEQTVKTPNEIIMSKRDEMAWELYKIFVEKHHGTNVCKYELTEGAYLAVDIFLKTKNSPNKQVEKKG